MRDSLYTQCIIIFVIVKRPTKLTIRKERVIVSVRVYFVFVTYFFIYRLSGDGGDGNACGGEDDDSDNM